MSPYRQKDETSVVVAHLTIAVAVAVVAGVVAAPALHKPSPLVQLQLVRPDEDAAFGRAAEVAHPADGTVVLACT